MNICSNSPFQTAGSLSYEDQEESYETTSDNVSRHLKNLILALVGIVVIYIVLIYSRNLSNQAGQESVSTSIRVQRDVLARNRAKESPRLFQEHVVERLVDTTLLQEKYHDSGNTITVSYISAPTQITSKQSSQAAESNGIALEQVQWKEMKDTKRKTKDIRYVREMASSLLEDTADLNEAILKNDAEISKMKEKSKRKAFENGAELQAKTYQMYSEVAEAGLNMRERVCNAQLKAAEEMANLNQPQKTVGLSSNKPNIAVANNRCMPHWELNV